MLQRCVGCGSCWLHTDSEIWGSLEQQGLQTFQNLPLWGTGCHRSFLFMFHLTVLELHERMVTIVCGPFCHLPGLYCCLLSLHRQLTMWPRLALNSWLKWSFAFSLPSSWDSRPCHSWVSVRVWWLISLPSWLGWKRLRLVKHIIGYVCVGISKQDYLKWKTHPGLATPSYRVRCKKMRRRRKLPNAVMLLLVAPRPPWGKQPAPHAMFCLVKGPSWPTMDSNNWNCPKTFPISVLWGICHSDWKFIHQVHTLYTWNIETLYKRLLRDFRNHDTNDID